MYKIIILDCGYKEILKECDNIGSNHLRLHEKIVLKGIRYEVSNITHYLDNETIKITVVREGMDY